jgi:hypothetical protein
MSYILKDVVDKHNKITKVYFTNTFNVFLITLQNVIYRYEDYFFFI